MSGPLAQVTERLYADFHTHATLRQVIAVVRRCANELDTPSQEAVPELVERLARQRLTDLAAHQRTEPRPARAAKSDVKRPVAPADSG
jgi:hypothetical protein